MSGQSSWHRLNADNGLRPHKRLAWVACNILNNMKSKVNLDPNLCLRRFPNEMVKIPEVMRETASSPSRLLCDMFWHALPWKQISLALGEDVRAVEFGCGSGRYGEVIRNLSGSSFAAYTGIDLHVDDEWEGREKLDGFRLLQGDSKDATSYLGDHNFVFTQSALEHFDDDLFYAQQVARWVHEKKCPVVQIHLIPSEACLWTYLWHGVRQYSPRTLSKITRLYGDETEKVLFFLGGKRSNAIHRRCYTRPMLLREAMPQGVGSVPYYEVRNQALLEDAQASQRGEACFYALVLASWLDEPLFT